MSPVRVVMRALMFSTWASKSGLPTWRGTSSGCRG
jgi:hypothetical protein